MEPVRRLLERLPAIGDLASDEALEDTLERLVSVGVAERFDGGPEAVWSIGPDRHHVAAFYRNGVLHHLLTRAVLEMALLTIVDADLPQDEALEACWETALELRDLLKFDFFFSRKREYRDELLAELDRLAPDWKDVLGTPDGAAQMLSRAELLVAPRTLLPFVESQWVVATVLADHDGALEDRGPFLDACTGLGQQWWRQQRLHGADVVSRELFSTALRAAENRALLGADATPAARAAWRDEVAGVRDQLRRVAEREHALRSEVFDAPAQR